jgi:hypothetical protein
VVLPWARPGPPAAGAAGAGGTPTRRPPVGGAGPSPAGPAGFPDARPPAGAPHPGRRPPPSGRHSDSPKARAAAAMQRLLRRCSFADLDGDEYSSDDDPDQEEDRLLGIADQQLSKAFMDGSWGPIASALDHFEEFAHSIRRILFLGLTGGHASVARAVRHNEQTLRLFVAFLSERLSKRPRGGEPGLSGNTIEGYLTHVRTAFSIHAAGRVDGIGLVIGRQVKGLKRGDGHRQKKLRLPFRSTHFRSAAAAGAAPRRQTGGGYSVSEVNKWALLCVMHAVLARAGEVGGSEKFDPGQGLSRAHIIHFPLGAGADTTPFFIVMLRPLKSGAGARDRVPVVVAKGDGSWADAYAVLMLLERVDPVRQADRHKVPAFRTAAGKQFCTGEITSAVRALCTAAGLDPSLYSSHSLRIGGATDLAMSGGTEVECRMAGRWHSDVWAIYAKPCLAMQLASSIRLCLAESVDMESLLSSAGVVGFNAPRGR